MMKRLLFVLLLLGVAGYAYASDSATKPEVLNPNDGWVLHGARNTVLLIQTTDCALGQALTDLSVGYDLYYSDNFASVDLAPYTDVFVAMDGGLVEDPSIANVAAWVSGGGHLHFYGGTCYQPYAIAMNNRLLGNDTNNYCWQTVYGSPHSTIVDAGHYLSQGLPATYNFSDISATYYQMRTTDSAISPAAVNGDGFYHLLSKPIGTGMFDICINSPYYYYYSYQSDYLWLKQVVSNMLNQGPVPTQDSSWGAIKALYR